MGHFALTGYLFQLLKTAQGSRIVTLSSNGYQNFLIDFDDLQAEKDYNALREYRQRNLANLIFSIELNRRIKAKGLQVLSIAAQPGANDTDLTRHLSDEENSVGKVRLGAFMKPWQGVLSSLYAAISNEAIGGNMHEPDDSGLRGYPTLATIKANAMDQKVANKLWDVAQEITGIKYPS